MVKTKATDTEMGPSVLELNDKSDVSTVYTPGGVQASSDCEVLIVLAPTWHRGSAGIKTLALPIL